MRKLLILAVACMSVAAQAVDQLWWTNNGEETNLKITLDVLTDRVGADYGYFTFTGDAGRNNVKILDKYTFDDSNVSYIRTAADIGVFITANGKTGYSVGRSAQNFYYSLIDSATIGGEVYSNFWHVFVPTVDATFRFDVLADGGAPTGQPLPGVFASLLAGASALAGVAYRRRKRA